MGKKRVVYYEVTWNDAHSKYGWRDRESIVREADGLECVTVGLILVNNKEILVIAGSRSEENDNVSDITTIPQVCVKKMRRLR